MLWRVWLRGAEKGMTDDPLGEPNPLWLWASDEAQPFGLGDTAELANWIGRVIVGYASIEFNFYFIYALINKLDPKESFHKFYSQRSIRNKELLLECGVKSLPHEYQAAMTYLWRTMRAAATRRTEVAHSAMLRSGEKLLRLQLVGNRAWLSEANKNLFVRTVRQYRTLQTDSQTFLSYLYMLDPERWEEVVTQLPVPQGNKNLDLRLQRQDSLPPRAAAELNASLKRLDLNRVLVIPAMYPLYTRYRLSFRGQTVLFWK